jgi:hypothetical protein
VLIKRLSCKGRPLSVKALFILFFTLPVVVSSPEKQKRQEPLNRRSCLIPKKNDYFFASSAK